MTLNKQETLPKDLQFEDRIWQENICYIAGIDEAGRGPLAGPVVAGAVIFAPYVYIEGVKDSKKLTPLKREKLYDLITENCLSYGIGVVDTQEIDRINIRQATFKAMRMAIGSLKQAPQYLLVDGEELPDNIYPQEGIVRGDNLSFTIAAASILAKVTRDLIMSEYDTEYPLYGFAKHKGYGTLFHRQMIKEHGACPLHRRLFLRKILSETD